MQTPLGWIRQTEDGFSLPKPNRPSPKVIERKPPAADTTSA
jgi:hypothetical protein